MVADLWRRFMDQQLHYTTIQVPTTLQRLTALQLQLQPFTIQVSTKGNIVQYTTIQHWIDQL